MCDTLVLVEEGRVLFGKNSDRDPNEAQPLEWHPAADHGEGATVRCTSIEVPQVAHTHAVLLSRPFWMWGAEMGANEHGVVIGNEAVFTDQPYADDGLRGMDLVRLALERAATAEAAVDVMIDLLEAHGQGGGCGHEDRSFTYHNSFLVADGTEAWVLETADRLWETEQVLAGARSISNGLTIPAFAEEHSDRLRTKVSSCRARRAITEAGAAEAQGPGDVMAILRTHEDGGAGPTYHKLNGAMAAPCMHAGGVVASSQTTASWAAELTPDGGRHWATGTAAPCVSLFKPVAVDEPLDLGPTPTDEFDDAVVWWRHERLHRAAMTDPERLLPLFVGERDTVEAAWLADGPEPAVAWKEADELVARWTAEVSAAADRDRRPAVVRRYWAERNERAGVPTPR